MSILNELVSNSLMRLTDVERVIATAPSRYKVYSIPKRSKGVRVIAHPARELKTLQRCLIKLAPAELGFHSAVTAYETGSSILENAKRHADNKWVARLDFKNFFNSITSSNWKAFLQQKDVDREFVEISSSLFFWRQHRKSAQLCLSVGAPSSPFVSNRILIEFDEYVESIAASNDLVYSRYADDITLSSKQKIDVDAIISDVLANMPEYLELEFNDEKTRLSGPGARKVITGLILTDDGEITLGKAKRKWIEACVFNFLSGRDGLTIPELRGYLNFLKQIEPETFVRLSAKLRKVNPAVFDGLLSQSD